ncbi:MAG: MFS transporter, partial [Gordonibacter sp.]|uniref:MFS transporter n=1 Tax=Gordonibacter sp. TaxID=1968902 RepID=UPI002FCB41DC
LGALFAFLGELTMALAPSTVVFIWVGRVLVGLGASFLIPSVLGIVPALYQGQKRIFAYGCVTAGTGAAGLMPIPFGMLLDAAGFRITFLVMAALFVLIMALSMRLPLIERPAIRPKFDKLGFATCSTGLFFLLTSIACVSICGIIEPLPQAPLVLFGIAPTVPMACLGVALLWAFSRIEAAKEQRAESPLMPRSFLGSRAARHSLLAVAFGFFLAGAFNILVIPYVQMAAGATALEAGLLFACAGVPMVLFAVGVPKVVPCAKARTVIRLGYAVGAAGCFIMAWGLGQPAVLVPVGVGMFFAGTGIGLVNSHASNAVACSVGEKDVQQSGGIQGTVRDIAHALAAALLGSVLALVLSSVFATGLTGDAVLSDVTRGQAVELPSTFTSDASFQQILDESDIAKADQEQVLERYRGARCAANQILLVGLGGLVLSLLLFTRGLPGHKKPDDSAADARGV